MTIEDAPGSPIPTQNPFDEMPVEQIQDAEREIDRLHDQHLNGGMKTL